MFKESAQSYVNNEGMIHVVSCLDELIDKVDLDFEEQKPDLFSCTNNIQVLVKDNKGQSLEGMDGNKVTKWISVTTNELVWI